MSDQYDYEIAVEKLNPPMGSKRFAAKLAFMVRLKEAGQSERLYPNLGEHWGVTEQEAEDKVKRSVEEWIKSRS
jgi:hypothetical protein